MPSYLLLLAGASGIAVGVGAVSVADGPAELELSQLTVGRVSVNDELGGVLALSAKRGGTAALQLLFREFGRSFPIARLDIRTGALAATVTGLSSELLFGLEVFLNLARRDRLIELEQQAFAATGTLGVEGNVKSVEGVPAKIAAAIESDLAEGSLVFYPRDNDKEVTPDLRQRCVARGLVLKPIDQLEEALIALGVTINGRWVKSPYRSLEAFERQHSRIFFGRKREIRQLVEQLETRAAAGRPGALVIGGSGSGKSSFCMAGVLPALELLSPSLEHAMWRPGDAIPTSRGETTTEADIARSVLANWRLRDVENGAGFSLAATLPDTSSLAELVAALPEDQLATRRHVWIIDQFEELFTLGFSTEAQISFARFLSDLQARGIWVIATLRNEFFNRYQDLHDGYIAVLTEVFGRDGQFDLARMGRDALRQVIVLPAELAGLRFETRGSDNTRLDDLILADAMDTADVLPLLEFTLQLLYDGLARTAPPGDHTTEQPRLLTFAAYEALGGIKGAIGKIVEPTFAALDAETRAALPRLLDALAVPIADSQRETARPTIVDQWPSGSPEHKLIDALVGIRVLVSDNNGHPGADSYVRVAHEALFTHWPEATAILHKSRQTRLIIDRLRIRVAQWLEEGRARFRLLRDDEVTEGVRIIESADYSIVDAALTEFVLASVEEDERLRVESAAKTVEMWETRNVALIEQSGKVAALAKKVIDRGDPMTAIIGLLEVLPTAGQERPWSPEAEAVLREALFANRELGVTGQRLPKDGGFLRGDNAVMTIGEDETVYRWEITEHLKSAEPLGGKCKPNYSVTSKCGRYAASSGGAGGIELWDFSIEPPKLIELPREEGIISLYFSSDSRFLLVACRKSVIWRLDGENVKGVLLPSDEKGAFHASFSGNSRYVVIGLWNNTAQVWDLTKWPHTAVVLNGHTGYNPHTGYIYYATINNDGSRVITLSADDTACLWRINDREAPVPTKIEGNKSRISCAAFSPDGYFFATGDSGGIVNVQRVEDSTSDPSTLTFHRDHITFVRFSSDSSKLVTGSRDGTACVWSLSKTMVQLLMIANHEGWVREGDISSDGQRLVTCAPQERMTRLWTLESVPRIVTTLHRNWAGVEVTYSKYSEQRPPRAADCAEFSPNGSYLAARYPDDRVLYWDIRCRNPTCIDLGGTSKIASRGKALSFSPDGKWLCAGNSLPRLWNLEGPAPASVGLHGIKSADAFAFSPDSRYLWMSLSPDGKVVVLDLWERYPRPKVLKDQQGVWFEVAFSSDCSKLATVNHGDLTVIWKMAPPASKWLRLPGFSQQGTTLPPTSSGRTKPVFSPTKPFLAIQLRNGGDVEIWNINRLDEPVARLESVKGVSHFKFSSDGNRIIAACSDGSINIWDSVYTHPVLVQQHHKSDAPVLSLAISPCGDYLATASADGAARLWSMTARRPIPSVLWYDRGAIGHVAFSSIGDKLLGTSEDGSVCVWPVFGKQALIAEAKATACRLLTDTQRETLGL